MNEPPSNRVSWERRLLDQIGQQVLRDPSVQQFSGMAAMNRYDLPAWELTILQRFQFGDLRLETPRISLVVEAESAGGLTNLVKYWPLLESRPEKRFALVHVFKIASKADYIAHRRLWDYVVRRMRDDLSNPCGLRWPEDWEASLHTYSSETEIDEIVSRIQHLLGVALDDSGA